MRRRIFSFILLVVMISSSVVFAQGNNFLTDVSQGNSEDVMIKNSIESFFDLYYGSIKDLKLNREIEGTIDNSDLKTFITRSLKFKIKQEKNNPIICYDLTLKYKNLEIDGNLATADVYVWCGFNYSNSPDVDSGMGSNYSITLKNNENNWIISEMDSSEFEFINYRNIKKKSGTNRESEINKLFDTKESNYAEIEADFAKRSISVQPKAQKKGLDIFSEDNFSNLLNNNKGLIFSPSALFSYSYNYAKGLNISPLALSSYSYNPTKGATYASYYAKWSNVGDSQKLFGYGGADCTNFVSQCVWAAYGGWIVGYTPSIISQNATNILNDVRQVTGTWYGSKNNQGSNKWCRVTEFHDYVIDSTKTKGPFGSTFGNKTPSTFSPSDIAKGDVLQLIVTNYAGGNYGHSLYVTQAGSTWDSILICCHSGDRQNTALSEFIGNPDDYPKMRRIRFTTGKFDK